MNTNYSDPVAGLPGMTADARIDVVETGIAGAAIDFGDALIASSGKVIPANADDAGAFRGVAVMSQTKVTGEGYVENDTVGVKRQGTIFVNVTEAVAEDDVAYCDVSEPGKFCKTATDNLATGGRFRSATTGAGVAILEINLP